MFYRRVFADVFAYVSHRVPEIADEPYRIDDAMRAGFGWELGPFETWDAVGFERGCAEVQARGLTLAPWIEAMRAAGATAFYRNREGVRECWNPATGTYAAVAGQEGRIALAWLPASATVWKNAGTTLQDLGDGVLNVAFHTKMNSIGAEVIEGLVVKKINPRGVVLSERGVDREVLLPEFAKGP